MVNLKAYACTRRAVSVPSSGRNSCHSLQTVSGNLASMDGAGPSLSALVNTNVGDKSEGRRRRLWFWQLSNHPPNDGSG
jgi:hypothetical protein